MPFDRAAIQAATFPHLVLTNSPPADPASDRPVFSLPVQSIDRVPAALEMKNRSDTPLKPLVNWIENRVNCGERIVCVLVQNAQVQRLISLLAPYGLTPEPLKRSVMS